MRKGVITVVALITAAAVAGCGGGGSKSGSTTTGASAGTPSARQLLVKTFDGSHAIKSGRLSLALKLIPSNSSTITQPVELSVAGPFASNGGGKLPESDFKITISAQGQVGVIELTSAGGKGYITVSGSSYQLPASTFKTVTSGFGSLASSGGASGSESGAGVFAKLGVQPLNWLIDPTIVGTATVAGTATTHIHAKVDATKMVSDISKLLGKAPSLGVTSKGTLPAQLPTKIPAATQARVVKELGTPSFDVWSGNSDHVVRKLSVAATIPVSGQIKSLLGGMTSAGVDLTFGYSDLNQPQTINAPTAVKPFSQLQAKVNTILQTIESGIATGSLPGSTGTSTAAAGGADQQYATCIAAAKGDVSKMQKCASLLGGS